MVFSFWFLYLINLGLHAPCPYDTLLGVEVLREVELFDSENISCTGQLSFFPEGSTVGKMGVRKLSFLFFLLRAFSFNEFKPLNFQHFSILGSAYPRTWLLSSSPREIQIVFGICVHAAPSGSRSNRYRHHQSHNRVGFPREQDNILKPTTLLFFCTNSSLWRSGFTPHVTRGTTLFAWIWELFWTAFPLPSSLHSYLLCLLKRGTNAG